MIEQANFVEDKDLKIVERSDQGILVLFQFDFCWGPLVRPLFRMGTRPWYGVLLAHTKKEEK